MKTIKKISNMLSFLILTLLTFFTLTTSQETTTTENPLQNFPPPKTLQELGIQLKTLVVNFNNDNFYDLLRLMGPRTEMCIQNLKMNFTKVFQPQIDSVVGLINATIQALPKDLYQKAQYIPDQINKHLMILLDPDRNYDVTTQKNYGGQNGYTTKSYVQSGPGRAQNQNSQTTQNYGYYQNQAQSNVQSYQTSGQSFQNSAQNLQNSPQNYQSSVQNSPQVNQKSQSSDTRSYQGTFTTTTTRRIYNQNKFK